MKRLYLFLKDEYIGDIHIDSVCGDEVFSFSFSRDYLRAKNKTIIDPELHFFEGLQYASSGTFGFIEDMIPDRFGKLLIERQFNENREIPVKLKTSDYLVLVNDSSRMCALRIKESLDGKYENSKGSAIPPLICLREIEHASIELESNNGVGRRD